MIPRYCCALPAVPAWARATIFRAALYSKWAPRARLTAAALSLTAVLALPVTWMSCVRRRASSIGEEHAPLLLAGLSGFLHRVGERGLLSLPLFAARDDVLQTERHSAQAERADAVADHVLPATELL